MERKKLFIITFLILFILGFTAVVMLHYIRRGFSGKITGCLGNVNIVDLKMKFLEDEQSREELKFMECEKEIVIYRDSPEPLKPSEYEKMKKYFSSPNSPCDEMVDKLYVSGEKPRLYIFANNCNNGVVCVWNSLADLEIGQLTITKGWRNGNCFEILKDSSGNIFAQMSDGNYASDAPLNETLSLRGKLEDAQFVISYRKIKSGSGPVRTKNDLGIGYSVIPKRIAYGFKAYISEEEDLVVVDLNKNITLWRKHVGDYRYRLSFEKVKHGNSDILLLKISKEEEVRYFVVQSGEEVQVRDIGGKLVLSDSG